MAWTLYKTLALSCGTVVVVGLVASSLRRRASRELSGEEEPQQATFAKLSDGTWGARIDGKAPPKGTELVLVRRDGTETRAVVESVEYEGKGYTLLQVKIEKAEKPKKARRKPGQRARELAEYAKENPGQDLPHYADWAFGEKTRTDRRVYEKPHWGYDAVRQADEKGFIHIVVDPTVQEGDRGHLKVFPWGYDFPSHMRLTASNRLIRKMQEERLPPERVPPLFPPPKED